MRNVRFLITLLMSIKCVIPYRHEKKFRHFSRHQLYAFLIMPLGNKAIFENFIHFIHVGIRKISPKIRFVSYGCTFYNIRTKQDEWCLERKYMFYLIISHIDFSFIFLLVFDISMIHLSAFVTISYKPFLAY